MEYGDHPDEHGEEDEQIEHHTMNVDLRTELADIVAWLPDIAPSSNLNETNWNSVDAIAKRLASVIDGIGEDVADSAFRESWKLKSQKIEAMLDELQSLVDASSGESN